MTARPQRAPEGRYESGRWPVPLIALVLYPLAAGAMALNLFFLFLLGRAVGVPDITPVAACVWGAALGVPATLWFAGWMRRLMDEADAGS